MRNKGIKQLKCPVCGEVLEKELPFFSMNGKNYITIGRCGEHGMAKTKVRIRKNEQNDLPYAIKTTRLIDADERDAVLQKYQKSISSKSE